MEREIESSLAMINNPWGEGTSIKCLVDTWDRSKLFSRADFSTVQPILAAISTKIQSQNEKLNGLKLLLQIVKDCSDSCLNENGASFVQQAARSCDKHNNISIRCYALLVIKQLANRAEKVQAMVKAITGNAVSQVVDCLNETSPIIKLHACHALSSILAQFSSSCGSVKATVEQKLVEILTLNNEKLALFAATSFARIPLIGGGGVGQQGHQAAITLLMKKTIASIHMELDSLYEGVQELPMGFPFNSKENLGLTPVSEVKPTTRLQKIERRIKFLCFYLNALLLEPMPVPKGIPIQDLIGLVCRTVGVTGTSLGSSQLMEVQVLRDLIPSVHTSLWNVINSLISICQTNLLIYQETFYQMINNNLAWTQTKKDSKSSHSFLRRQVYLTLSNWLRGMKGASGVESYTDNIVPHILLDVTPEKEAVVLKAVKQAVKRKKGKAAEKPSNIQVETSTPKVYDTELCEAALEAMNSILIAAGNLIKASHHKAMQELVVALLVDLQRGLDPHPLYSSEKCQLRLYEILQSLILFSHPLCPPATVYATTLFSTGQMSRSNEISRFCQQAMQIVQRVSFPVYPSIVLESEVLDDLQDQAIANKGNADSEEEEEEDLVSEPEEVNEQNFEEDLNTEKELEISEAQNVEAQNKASSESEKADSDLEFLEEIPSMPVEDAAPSDIDEEENLRQPEEVTIEDDVVQQVVDTVSVIKFSEVDIELISEQPSAKKARTEEKAEDDDVSLMLADFVE